MLRRFLNTFKKTKWVDIDTYYNGSDYQSYLLQMCEDANGKKYFQNIKISTKYCTNPPLQRLHETNLHN